MMQPPEGGGRDRGPHDSRDERSFRLLAALIASVGTDSFYVSLGEFAAQHLGRKKWMLLRYRKFARPDILINRYSSPQLGELYLAGLYRLDPILELVLRGDAPPVTTFQELESQGTQNAAYLDLFRRSSVRDELIILSPEIGGAYLGFFLASRTTLFTDEDVRRTHVLYSVLAPLHRLHIERSLARDVEAAVSDHATRKVVTDSTGQVIHRSPDWTTHEREVVDRIIEQVSGGIGPSASVRVGEYVLHWESLAADHALAPGGRIFFLERRSPGFVQSDIESSLASFALVNHLSPRERELVRLTVRGYPTSGIARKLNLTVGTVKSYKHRLYEKLDITTEREVFWQFIAHLFGDEESA
jgi:DNA-binding CsgD family transcriptional regulator